jgi:hypothetical protein
MRLPALGALLLAVSAVATVPRTTLAQGAGNGFLFKKPVGSFSLHAGYAMANAGSQVFDDATDLLTLSRRDFDGIAWGGDISLSLGERTDLVFSGEFSSASANSEYREFVESNDEPIRQATKFKRVPLAMSVKYYLADRGRSISQFAWIPNRYAPYVGVGGGAMWYRFRQNGDFVDFDTPDLEIVTDEVQSSGWAPMAQAMAGLDYTVGNWVALTFEGRYGYAKARLDPERYEGFDKIDLSGFAGTVGFRVRF